MHLELTPEAILTQLGYPANEETLKQITNIIQNTDNFNKFSHHIPSFNDALAVEKAFIGLSNSHNYLKIKCGEDATKENVEGFNALVKHWSDKYKLTLEKVKNKNTYYFLGQK